MLKEYSAMDVIASRKSHYVRIMNEINYKIYHEMMVGGKDFIQVEIKDCKDKCMEAVIENMKGKGFNATAAGDFLSIFL